MVLIYIGYQRGKGMKFIRWIMLFVVSIVIGLVIGKVVVDNGVGLEDIHVKAKDLFSKDEFVIREGLDDEGMDIKGKDYVGDTYILRVEQKFEGFKEVNFLIRDHMYRYFSLAASALDREIDEKSDVEHVRVLVGTDTSYIGFDLSKERYQSIKKHVGKETLEKHAKGKGWDILNNVDTFYMSKDVYDSINQEVRERIKWENARDEIE